MSLRIQKSWSQLGKPQQPGTYSAPGVGTILGLTQEHIDEVERLGGNVVVVLAHSESSGMVPEWEIISIAAGN
jgi:hypothetical protein